MDTQEYFIGDAANLTGVSRDTLRLYEKKGLITIRKKENGYRYFTEDDIYYLSDILDTCDTPKEGVLRWLSLSQTCPGLDMSYIYDCYHYQSGFSLTAVPEVGAEEPARLRYDSHFPVPGCRIWKL